MNDFKTAVSFVLDREGYWSELAGDPGGLTIWGISARSWPDAVMAMKSMTKDASREYAKRVYKEKYWDKSGCGEMSSPMNIVVFDTAVNCGTWRAGKFMEGGGDWRDYLCRRVRWQIYESKSRYTVGLLNRINELFNAAKSA